VYKLLLESGIPFTLQSLAVFVVAGFLTSHEAKICLVAYVIIGLIGLPVFANGSAGIDKILGPSGGFLYGFIFSGWFISSTIQKIKPLNWAQLLGIYVLATVILFVFGLFHLTLKFDLSQAFEYGFHPFWKMGFIKALFASLIVGFLRREDILRKSY